VYDTLYRQARGRVRELVGSLSELELAGPLPATPNWSGRDLVAHLVGVAADVASGNLAGMTTEPWTAAQIERSKGRDLDDLFAEWDETGPQLERAVAERRVTLPPVHDLAVHETDLREAHCLPRAPQDSMPPLLNSVLTVVARNNADQPGGLLVTSGDQQWRIGSGEPQASVEVEPYELYRGVFSRRSRRQLRAWPWRGDPGPYIDLLPVFGGRDDDQPTI